MKLQSLIHVSAHIVHWDYPTFCLSGQNRLRVSPWQLHDFVQTISRQGPLGHEIRT